MKLYRDKDPLHGYWHWCPACEELHRLPMGWQFDGNMEAPTFVPSFKRSQTRAKGQVVLWCCHYILTAGVLLYQKDNTHGMNGQSVPLPEIPAGALEEYNL